MSENRNHPDVSRLESIIAELEDELDEKMKQIGRLEDEVAALEDKVEEQDRVLEDISWILNRR